MRSKFPKRQFSTCNTTIICTNESDVFHLKLLRRHKQVEILAKLIKNSYGRRWSTLIKGQVSAPEFFKQNDHIQMVDVSAANHVQNKMNQLLPWIMSFKALERYYLQQTMCSNNLSAANSFRLNGSKTFFQQSTNRTGLKQFWRQNP